MSEPHEPEPRVATGDAAQTTSKAGRDLRSAITVGLGIGAVVLASLFVYRPVFGVLVVLVAVLAIREVATATRHLSVVVADIPLMLGGAAMCIAAWFWGLQGLAIALLLAYFTTVVWRMSMSIDGFVFSSALSAFILLYVPFLGGFVMLMANREAGAMWIVTWAVAVVCNDTGGYAAGVFFGKHPMAPAISPKKSWEGFGGSVLAASISSVIFFVFSLEGQWWHGVLFGIALAGISTLGDLAESMIKRDMGIKDMSSLLPGHGGVMDRLDSLLFSAPVAWMLLTLFVG